MPGTTTNYGWAKPLGTDLASTGDEVIASALDDADADLKAEETARIAADSAEASTRASADSSLDNRLDSVEATLPNKADLVSGVVASSQIPAQAITTYLGDVASDGAMTALVGQAGDWVTRSDLPGLGIVIAEPSSVLGNWKKITFPTGSVVSVNAQTGIVTLSKSDIGLGSVDNTPDTGKPVSTAQQTALNLKANDNAIVHLAGAETVAGVKTFSSDPIIPDEAYGGGWNGSLEPATKNALFDKIDTLALAADLSKITANRQTGPSYTPTLSDAGGIIETNSSSPFTGVFPTHAAVPLPIGTVIGWFNYGTGLTTFDDSDVTAHAPDGLTIGKQYGVALWRKMADNEWDVQVAAASTEVIDHIEADHFAVIDSFDRANSATTMGSTETRALAWAASAGVWGISSNQAYKPSGSYGLVTVPADAQGIGKVTIAAFSPGDEFWLVGRETGGSTYVRLGKRAANSTYTFESVGAGGDIDATPLVAFPTVVAGDVLEIISYGDSDGLACRINGVLHVDTGEAIGLGDHGWGLACVGAGGVRFEDFRFTPLPGMAGHPADTTNVHGIADTSALILGKGGGKEGLVTGGNSGTAFTIALTNGNVVTVTMTGNCTFTMPAVANDGAYSFTLVAIQDGTGSRTGTFPAAVKWAGGVSPVLTPTPSKRDVFTFVTYDGGTSWFGFIAGQNYA